MVLLLLYSSENFACYKIKTKQNKKCATIYDASFFHLNLLVLIANKKTNKNKTKIRVREFRYREIFFYEFLYIYL